MILDYDRDADLGLAKRLNAAAHPAFAVVEPNSDTVAERRFGPVPPDVLRDWLERIIQRYGG
ncbi:MAG: hypothetical protein FJZ92_10495 [Chloroflexi bacterium]|nr:hypothetical protein [Chloroflexota bacterium]